MSARQAPAPLGAAAALERLGTARLCSLALVLLVFVALHLCRLPLLLAARVLGAAMARADLYLTHLAAVMPTAATPRTEGTHA